MTYDLAIGDLVYVSTEKRPYRVRAASSRYAVCTKPFFATTLYFVIDFDEQQRGPEDRVFGFGAETDDHCTSMLARIASGVTAISRRHGVSLDIVRVKRDGLVLLRSDMNLTAPLGVEEGT